MNQNNYEKTDAVGKWFQAYKELQEPYQIGFEFKSANQSDLILISHIEHDGSGAVRKICSENSVSCRVQAKDKYFKPPGLFKKIQAILAFLYITRPHKNVWPLKIEKTSGDQLRRVIYEFDTQQTRLLKEKAEASGVSLNSLLFHNLNKSLKTEFNISSGLWWMPVNMRAELGMDPNDDTKNGNFVSNFTIRTSDKLNLQDTHAEIKKCLSEKRHWGTWYWQLSADFLPFFIIKKLAAHGLKNNYIGAFSNLGDWSCSSSEVKIFPLINTLRSHPLAAGVIVWNDRLFLSLRFYDGLNISNEQIQSLMRKWTQNLNS